MKEGRKEKENHSCIPYLLHSPLLSTVNCMVIPAHTFRVSGLSLPCLSPTIHGAQKAFLALHW